MYLEEERIELQNRTRRLVIDNAENKTKEAPR
jgi:hypothetical protein